MNQLDNLKTKKRQLDLNVIRCKSCGCAWLEQIEVKQFYENHNVILGQRIPSYGDYVFYILRCIKCNELHEPHVQIGPRDQFRQAYDRFLDEMEGPKNISMETI